MKARVSMVADGLTTLIANTCPTARHVARSASASSGRSTVRSNRSIAWALP